MIFNPIVLSSLFITFIFTEKHTHTSGEFKNYNGVVIVKERKLHSTATIPAKFFKKKIFFKKIFFFFLIKIFFFKLSLPSVCVSLSFGAHTRAFHFSKKTNKKLQVNTVIIP